ncbi:hypothetical protein DFJ74DRAFT_642959 [Hyaloraphidium curvatum]|nr:hypothetical protein DFJ74DRAFT_642959 [Hyaloraphidium curvatum]
MPFWLTYQRQRVVREIRKIASLADDGVVYTNLSAQEGSAVPSSSGGWPLCLRCTLARLAASEDSAKDSLPRFFPRENATARRLLNDYIQDVAEGYQSSSFRWPSWCGRQSDSTEVIFPCLLAFSFSLSLM